MNYKGLAKSYSPLLSKKELVAMLSTVDSSRELIELDKFELHRSINDLILDNYHGENYYKYILVKEFLARKVVAAFEVIVNESRLDFLSINGDTKSFEIKTSLDTFNRLEKQISDYSRVFEYNYVVVSYLNLEDALLKIPENYGVWVVNGGKKVEFRKAQKNLSIEARSQLCLFTKLELNKVFGTTNHDSILTDFKATKINERFKSVLKNRYEKKWKFVAENQNKILPIDFQFFFKSNVSPALIYS